MIATYTANLTERQQAWFYAEYQHAAKSEVAGVLLAAFLGGFGIHKFYLGQTGAGVLYLIFSWTGIPTILGFIECFFMPGRVRRYNSIQAQYIMGGIMASSGPQPAAGVPSLESSLASTRICPSCGGTVQADAAFCAQCGSAMTAGV